MHRNEGGESELTFFPFPEKTSTTFSTFSPTHFLALFANPTLSYNPRTLSVLSFVEPSPPVDATPPPRPRPSSFCFFSKTALVEAPRELKVVVNIVVVRCVLFVGSL